MEQKRKAIILFSIGMFCIVLSVFANVYAQTKDPDQNNKTTLKQEIKKEKLKKSKELFNNKDESIEWENFSQPTRSPKGGLTNSITAGADQPTRKLAQNITKAVTQEIKACREKIEKGPEKLNQILNEQQETFKKNAQTIIRHGARQGTGGFIAVIGAIGFCLSIAKKSDEKDIYAILGTIGVAAIGAALLLL